jgi:hypothetical protein
MASSKTPATESDAWIPTEPGAILTGEVVDIDTAWSQFRASQHPDDDDAGWYPLLTIKEANGAEVKLHAFRTVLYNEIMRKQPKVGETVTVTYVGEGKDPGGGMNPAKIFRVKIDGRGASEAAYSGLRPAKGPGATAAEQSDLPTGLEAEDAPGF